MQVVSTRSSASIARGGLTIIPQRNLVSLYQECPNEELDLDEFEEMASDRLNVLRNIEQLRAKGLNESDNEYLLRLKEIEGKLLPLKSLKDARKDRSSHFILRLAYCRSEDLRNWFLAQESHLLRFRLDSMSDNDRASFMEANGIVYRQLTSTEMNEMKDKLMGLSKVNEANFLSTKYYK